MSNFHINNPPGPRFEWASEGRDGGWRLVTKIDWPSKSLAIAPPAMSQPFCFCGGVGTLFQNLNVLYFDLNSPRDALFNAIHGYEIGLLLCRSVEMSGVVLRGRHRTEPGPGLGISYRDMRYLYKSPNTRFWLANNPRLQPVSPLAPAVAVEAAPVAGLEEFEVLSAHVPRRRPNLSRVCGYAAAVGPRRGHGARREELWPIRGVQQVRSSGGSPE